MRRWILSVMCMTLLAVGCQAQAPVGAKLQRSVAKLVQATFHLPPWVGIKVLERKPSTQFPGYDALTVQLSHRAQSQTRQMLLSKDGKTLYSFTKMDLTSDPQAETMAKIDLRGRPVRGNKDAKVTVVVYDDFECPYCSRMHETLRDLLKTYGDRIRVIYKDYPLKEIHPWAQRAAIDSECLARQSGDAFWDFADYVHANGQQIRGNRRPLSEQKAAVDRIAMDAGKRHSVDAAALKACIQKQSPVELNKSIAEAEALGVQATPTIFVDGMKMDGAIPEQEFREVLDKELR